MPLEFVVLRVRGHTGVIVLGTGTSVASPQSCVFPSHYSVRVYSCQQNI